MAFGDRLRELRTERGLSQDALAQALGYTKTAISQYELGKRAPNYQTLSHIAAFFHVSTDYLLGRTDDRGSGRVREHRGGYDLNEVAKTLPPDLVEAIEALPEESRHVFLRARKNLTEEDWRSIVSFIQFRLSEAEKKNKDQG